jgi:hypothetical protein
MYATCLFCNKTLGTNEALETFPVGRRLAFDAAKGRLWVVCRHCERWNLSPLEERWEAIEQAERLYRDTRRRVATDQIGLAKLRDGTELVRIGEPLRPEFAAWRYGDQFGRRRRRQMLIAGAGITAIGGLIVGGSVAGVGIGGFGWMLARMGNYIIKGSPEEVVARVSTADGKTLRVRRRHLAETSLVRGTETPLAINLRFAGGQAHFEGSEAMRIAGLIVPATNRYGGAKDTVSAAVKSIESYGGPDGFLERLTETSVYSTRPAELRRRWGRSYNYTSTGLFGLTTVQRLALEMALHEEAERRAMAGELALLERAWREAEEIAAISDDLFVPGSVRSAIDKMRGR